MARSFGSSSPTQPFSVGDIVSAAFQLYRSHLKQYLGIAVRATLWGALFVVGLLLISGLIGLVAQAQSNPLGLLMLMIPVVIALFIYCIAKAEVNWALISWLAYGELTQQPESTQAGRRLLSPRIWRFFWMLVLVWLLGVMVSIGLSTIQQVVVVSALAILGSKSVLFGLLVTLLSIVSTVVSAWFSARWFLPELAIAVENSTVPNSITRSWDLTQGQTMRVLTVLFIGLLVTLPLYILAFLPLGLALIATAASLAIGNTGAILGVVTALVLSLLLLLPIGLFVTPFWQTLKAVLYYDLRSRREGLDLRLRPRPDLRPDLGEVSEDRSGES
jgi:hypothetical protein